MAEKDLQTQIDDLNELIKVIRQELKEAQDLADHHEAWNLHKELTRAVDRRRQLAAELHLRKHPEKRAKSRKKRVKVLCPDCGRHYMTLPS